MLLERKVERRAADDRVLVERHRASADQGVVPVEGDVDRPEPDLDTAALGDERLEPPRERDASRVDPDQSDVTQVDVPLDHLVSEPRNRPRQRVFVEDLARTRAHGGVVVHDVLLPGLTGPA